MHKLLDLHLSILSSPKVLPLLCQLRRGIEKEGLRVSAAGELSRKPHPTACGSALTHPRITTDFSEALIELVTPVTTSVDQALHELDRIHRFVYESLGDELLWTASMPGELPEDDEIPVARYGASNIGRFKTVYRVGLGHRYGRRMQMIAGIHYNFSLPHALWEKLGVHGQSEIDAAYFRLIRNFQRTAWLLHYLFGASPALAASFAEGSEHRLRAFNRDTLYLPYATALRMGELGYRSSAIEALPDPYGGLSHYVETLTRAILTPYPEYERIGVYDSQGYRQLSTGLLQSENEFYAPIRPKRVPEPGESVLTALAQRGVEYVEVRCLDINPYLPLGVGAEQLRFLDAYLLLCLLKGLPSDDLRIHGEAGFNLNRVVEEGRRPGLRLVREGRQIEMRQWAAEILDEMKPIAALLDRAIASTLHMKSIENQRAKLSNHGLTPSGRILSDLLRGRCSWSEFALERSRRAGKHFLERPLAGADRRAFAAMRELSKAKARALDSAAQPSFGEYLAGYFEQYQALLPSIRTAVPSHALLDGVPATG